MLITNGNNTLHFIHQPDFAVELIEKPENIEAPDHNNVEAKNPADAQHREGGTSSTMEEIMKTFSKFCEIVT